MTSLSVFATSLHETLQKVTHVSIVSHVSPDGDALGSLMGLTGLLRENYSHLEVSPIVPTESAEDDKVTWILGDIATEIPSVCDLLIVVDTGQLSRTRLPSPLPYPGPILCIDHHQILPDTLDGYLESDAPSTTYIITKLAGELHWTMTSDIATALLLGLYTDTGGFLHSNSTASAFEMAASLIRAGARQEEINQKAFGNFTLEYLHALGRSLQSIVVQDGVACLFLPSTEVHSRLKNYIITYLSGIQGTHLACVCIERDDGVRCSLRTRGDTVNCSDLAKRFGGGGHKEASGFTLENAIIQQGKIRWNGKEYTEDLWIDEMTKHEKY